MESSSSVIVLLLNTIDRLTAAVETLETRMTVLEDFVIKSATDWRKRDSVCLGAFEKIAEKVVSIEEKRAVKKANNCTQTHTDKRAKSVQTNKNSTRTIGSNARVKSKEGSSQTENNEEDDPVDPEVLDQQPGPSQEAHVSPTHVKHKRMSDIDAVIECHLHFFLNSCAPDMLFKEETVALISLIDVRDFYSELFDTILYSTTSACIADPMRSPLFAEIFGNFWGAAMGSWIRQQMKMFPGVREEDVSNEMWWRSNGRRTNIIVQNLEKEYLKIRKTPAEHAEMYIDDLISYGEETRTAALEFMRAVGLNVSDVVPSAACLDRVALWIL
ncbi:hypothetical protein QR680_004061 [Steinernema hermaphroditum]|uniref:Uncharacterized protein n=1 Tax=Steinernema hermaphroditum TaxID=289476 RepID=A0AA39HMJ2_9BILA|nr:hypothetical protein QR680_004061 [Steinernema hermaphroditum]